jgi:hypothetical protein
MKKASKKLAAENKVGAEALDVLHDSGAELSRHLDMSSSRRPGLQIKRVNVDFPIWMIEQLDEEASRLGITRQSVIKFWISERLAISKSKKIA